MSMTEKDVAEALGQISATRLRSWVRRGWIQPGRQGRRVVFTEIDVARARLVSHLTERLEVSDDEVPVILSLMDQVYGLRRALRTLGRAVESQPETVRADIARVFRELDRLN
jgi:chaperone modulatory protein CbpM